MSRHAISLIFFLIAPVSMAESLTERFKPKAIEPTCLNCCMFEEILHECDSEGESAFRKRFLIHRAFITVPLSFLSTAALYPLVSRSSRLYVSPSLVLLSGLIRFTGTSLNQFLTSIKIWFLTSNKPSDTAPESLILILRAHDDWNGALSSPYVARLSESHIVLLQDINNLHDMGMAIANAKKRFKLPIRGLFIEGHGNPEAIHFGADTLTLGNLHVMKEILNLLDAETTIFLASCRSAYESSDSMGSIARFMASLANGRRVFGNVDYTSLLFEVDPLTFTPQYNGALALLPSSLFIDGQEFFDTAHCYQTFVGNDDADRCPIHQERRR